MPVFNKFYEQRVKELWLNKPLFEIDGKKYYRMPDGCLPPATPKTQPKHGINIDKEKDQYNGNR